MPMRLLVVVLVLTVCYYGEPVAGTRDTKANGS